MKTLITKLSTDVTMFTTEQIDAYKAFMKASFAPGGFNGIDFEVVEDPSPALPDVLARLLQSVRDEFRGSDERPRD